MDPNKPNVTVFVEYGKLTGPSGSGESAETAPDDLFKEDEKSSDDLDIDQMLAQLENELDEELLDKELKEIQDGIQYTRLQLAGALAPDAACLRTLSNLPLRFRPPAARRQGNAGAGVF